MSAESRVLALGADLARILDDEEAGAEAADAAARVRVAPSRVRPRRGGPLRVAGEADSGEPAAVQVRAARREPARREPARHETVPASMPLPLASAWIAAATIEQAARSWTAAVSWPGVWVARWAEMAKESMRSASAFW